MSRSIAERHRRGRPGQVRGSQVYCPLTGNWLAQTRELEISGNRTFYDLIPADKVKLDENAADFNEMARLNGWRLPDQLLEVVTLCQYCEAYCLNKDTGPSAIPRLELIDRSNLTEVLHGDGAG